MSSANFVSPPTRKVYVPPRHEKHIVRPRLISKMDESIQYPFTLVAAPPGAGKSTLLTDWAHLCAYAIIWYDLKDEDNDPARFWTYLIELIEFLYPGLCKAVLSQLKSPEHKDYPTIIDGLVETLRLLHEPLFIVVDDYHHINNAAIHRSMTHLLNGAPCNLHLVISSRTYPPLSALSKMRESGRILEINDMLRFTADEARTYFLDVMRLDLHDRDITRLQQYTEGWIAALQIAALSLQKYTQDEATEFIQKFSGSNRQIIDYLANRVMDGLPRDLRDFLIQTSILDELNASVCDALTDRNDSYNLLTEIDRANLFIIALDHAHTRYRYHHLFSDFLRDRLNACTPDVRADLHRRASNWYEQRQKPHMVIRHRLAMEDYDYAVKVIEQTARQLILAKDVALLIGWLKSLPQHLFNTHPQLYVSYAWALAIMGDFEQAENQLALLEQMTELPLVYRAELLAIRATIVSNLDEPTVAVELSNQALENLPKDDFFARPLTYMNIAKCSPRVTAQTYLQSILDIQNQPQLLPLQVEIRGIMCLIAQNEGRLTQSLQYGYEALTRAGEWEQHFKRILSSTDHVYWGLAETYLLLHELHEVEQHLEKALGPGRSDGDIHIYILNLLARARLEWLMGNPGEERKALEQAERLASQMNILPLIRRAFAVRTRLALANGDIQAAERWLATHQLHEMTRRAEQEYLTQGWALMAVGRYDEALNVLEALKKARWRDGRIGQVIEVIVLKALVYAAMGDKRQGLERLAKAVEHGTTEGHIHDFVQFGPPAQKLLLNLLHIQWYGEYPSLNTAYLTRLLQVFGTAERLLKMPERLIAVDATPREMAVFTLEAQGMSIEKIAVELNIPLTVVEQHLRTVMAKLEHYHRNWPGQNP